MRTFRFEHISSPLNASFAISRGARTTAESVRVWLSEDGATGRGECLPYSRYGESVESVCAQLEAVRGALESGVARNEVQSLMPAGAARCAVDGALWDLEAKQTSVPVWQRAGLPEAKPLATTMTLSIADAQAMAEAAKGTPATILKLKLGGPQDLDRVAAVRAARPDAKLIVDGNEAIAPDGFDRLIERMAELGVSLIEQPFPVGDDELLRGRNSAVPICTDESVHTSSDLEALAEKYDVINIKLDKAGGLTEGLLMLSECRRLGLGVMVGCMVVGSLNMAPAVLLGQAADLVDLDGPLWLKRDIEYGLHYEGGTVSPPERALWG
ncbi:MAG: N-acetyl-D-Glu racemase DgcA [Pseudomonadota bacterium]